MMRANALHERQYLPGISIAHPLLHSLKAFSMGYYSSTSYKTSAASNRWMAFCTGVDDRMQKG